MPYILVVGDKEKQNGTVAVRGLGGLDLGAIAFDDFVARLSRTSPPAATLFTPTAALFNIYRNFQHRH